jgi:hypothetical protein
MFVCSMCVLLLILGSWVIASTSYGNSDAYLKSWEHRRIVWRNRSYYNLRASWKMREIHQAHLQYVHRPVSMRANAMFSRFLKEQIIIQAAANISFSRREELKEYADKYKPSIQFKDGEPYFPCDFYFDHDTNIGDNKDSYPKGLNEKFNKLRYFVHIQENAWDKSISETAIAIEYWYYYVADTAEGAVSGA